MAYDCTRNEYKKYIGRPTDKPYFNTGVMLMDIWKWREHKCMDKIWKHISEVCTEYPFVDQDYINVVLSDDIYPIDMRYNVLSAEFLYSWAGTLKVYGLHPAYWYDEAIYRDALARPVIYHFNGVTFIRPWYINSLHPAKKQYDSFYQMSPWRNDEQEKFALDIPHKVQLFLRRMPSFINIPVASILQRLLVLIMYKC